MDRFTKLSFPHCISTVNGTHIQIAALHGRNGNMPTKNNTVLCCFRGLSETTTMVSIITISASSVTMKVQLNPYIIWKVLVNTHPPPNKAAGYKKVHQDKPLYRSSPPPPVFTFSLFPCSTQMLDRNKCTHFKNHLLHLYFECSKSDIWENTKLFGFAFWSVVVS